MYKLIFPLVFVLVACAPRELSNTQTQVEELSDSTEAETELIETPTDESPAVVVPATNQDSTVFIQPSFADTKVSSEEYLLYAMIMFYRDEYNLPKIPLSKSLTFVAQSHCYDLVNNKPDIGTLCNAHSWSDKGIWSSCCYTEDHAQSKCMWNKPREMTPYSEIGFEIACGTNDQDFSDFVMTAEYALESWKASQPHNDVILNRGVWADYPFGAIGVAIYKDFACVWFGPAIDAEGEPKK